MYDDWLLPVNSHTHIYRLIFWVSWRHTHTAFSLFPSYQVFMVFSRIEDQEALIPKRKRDVLSKIMEWEKEREEKRHTSKRGRKEKAAAGESSVCCVLSISDSTMRCRAKKTAGVFCLLSFSFAHSDYYSCCYYCHCIHRLHCLIKQRNTQRAYLQHNNALLSPVVGRRVACSFSPSSFLPHHFIMLSLSTTPSPGESSAWKAHAGGSWIRTNRIEPDNRVLHYLSLFSFPDRRLLI